MKPGSSESQVSSQPPRPGRGEDASLATRAGVWHRRAAAAAGGPRVAPPGARAFPPEFPSGSSDSRGKLNILGQGEASCQVPTLHGVLPPPPPSPPPPPPPTPQPPRRHQPPKYQLNRRDRGAAAVAAAAAAARERVRCSPHSGPSRQAEKVPFPRKTLLGSRGSWGRAGGTGSSLPLAPVGRGGGEGTRAGGKGGGLGRSRGRRLFPGRRCLCSYFSPPSSSSSESCREPQPKQAAASGSARRPPPTAPPSHSEEKNT